MTFLEINSHLDTNTENIEMAEKLDKELKRLIFKMIKKFKEDANKS